MLRFKRHVLGCYNRPHEAGSVIPYQPWPYEWQGKTEEQRVAQGLFVMCYGQGEFDVFGPEDVELVAHHTEKP